MENKLKGLHELDHSFQQHNSSLETHFSEARSNLDTISKKLHDVKPSKMNDFQTQTKPSQEESKVITLEIGQPEKQLNSGQQPATLPRNEPVIPQEHQPKETPNNKAEETVNHQGIKQDPATLPSVEQGTQEFQIIASARVPEDDPVSLDEIFQNESVIKPIDGSDAPSSVQRQRQTSKEEDEPDWEQLFTNGLEGKEKVLLAEYTNTLRNYKEAKRRLGEIEKKSQLDVSGIQAQLEEMKNYNAMKDEEIHTLRQRLNALQKRLEEYKNAKEKEVGPARNDEPPPLPMLPMPEEEDDIGILVVDEHEISPAEQKLRADIDEILEENLDFWMRFSSSFGQLQKFQNGVQDLFSELAKLEKDKEKKDGSSHGNAHASLKSDIRPIYKHLREIETELTVWLEQSEKLKEELQRRFSQLCNIQGAIKHAVNAGAEDDDMKFTSYNAAKFQGEVANMQQENHKVADELQAGMDHITSLQVEVERTMTRLNEELGFSGTKSQNENEMRSGSRGKGVPLSSFIFGVKPQKKKQSIFSCMHPAMMHRKYQNLKSDKSE